ncbi:MAG TPA: Error-prone repair protein ImuA [Puia sp.]
MQKEILPLQGYKTPAGTTVELGLGPVAAAFPNGIFPTGAVHEFLSTGAEEAAATGGFVAGVLGGLMREKGVCIWIGCGRMLFPPALKLFGVEPDRVIFVDLKREKDGLWAMEEALKCEGLAAVVGELKEIDFTASRRLQLAVEQSRVTSFILRPEPRKMNTTACVARWRIRPVSSALEQGMPGVGFPRWKVELLKIRNGRPGSWDLEWSAGGFKLLGLEETSVSPQTLARLSEEKRKTG